MTAGPHATTPGAPQRRQPGSSVRLPVPGHPQITVTTACIEIATWDGIAVEWHQKPPAGQPAGPDQITTCLLAHLAVLGGGHPDGEALRDEFTVTRHARLARQFMTHVARGDTYQAGVWLRRTARDPSVSPWLLLDLAAAHDAGVPGPRPHPPGRSHASGSRRDEHQAVQARGTP